MFTHIAVVRDLVETQYKEYQEVRIHNHNKGFFWERTLSWYFFTAFKSKLLNCIHRQKMFLIIAANGYFGH